MVSFEYRVNPTMLNEGMVAEWLNDVVNQEQHKTGAICIILGSDEWLLEYNKRFLDHDFYTDIITFDYSEGVLVSGDLLISYDRVKDNAIQLNVSRETELHRVLVHGVLHLCGYKDEVSTEKEIMRNKEDYYLKLL